MAHPTSKPRPYRFVQRLIDRHGHWRNYLRRPGFARITLVGLYGTEEFAESYRLAMGGGGGLPLTAVPVGAGRTIAGSINALIVAYKQAAHWAGLALNSKRNRHPIMEKLRSHPAWSGVMVRDLATKHVRRIIEDLGPAPHAKKHALKTLRGLFAYAIEIQMIEDDPSAGIKIKAPKTGGYHTWTDDEIEQYRAYWKLGTEPRLVLEFALETASRRCEVVRLGRQHVRGGRIKIARAKGCNAVDIAVTAELNAAIKAMPKTDRLLYLMDGHGKPYTPDALGHKFPIWANEAGMPTHCRMHGLRKARTRQIIEAGGTAHDAMGQTGHKTLAEVQRYADEFNRTAASDRASELLVKAGRKAKKKKAA